MNWRDPGPRLDDAGDGFPVVLAADVLYERRDVDPLLALVERVVARDGELWLTEPGRPPAARFLKLIGARGWIDVSHQCCGPSAPTQTTTGRGSWSRFTGCGGVWLKARRLFSCLIVRLAVADDDGLALFAHELLHVVGSQTAFAGAARGFPAGK